jgi:signal peptidase
MRLWERLLNGLTALLLVAGLLVLGGALLGRPLLLAAVPTGSMLPDLRPGALIPIIPTWVAGPLQRGEVIVFRTETEDRWIVHRIMGGDAKTGFITKGDANTEPDQPLVHPGDVAGIVPQPGGKVLSLPGLGLLTTSTIFSNPFTALAAGLVGLFLLKGKRSRREQRSSQRVAHAPAIYLSLIVITFAGTFLTAWSLSTKLTIRYTVVAQHPTNVQIDTVYLPGETHVEEIVVTNTSLIPVLAVYLPDDPTIRFDRSYGLIWPQSSDRFRVTVSSNVIGTHESTLIAGLYLPFLPPSLLVYLTGIHLLLAGAAVALVPTTIVTGIALMDPQVRRWLLTLRNRLLLEVNL